MFRSICSRATAPCVLTLCLTGGFAQAQALRVLTLTPARAAACKGKSFAFTSDDFFKAARAALLNKANFGTSGRVKRAIQFQTPAATLTVANLSDADIVLLPPGTTLSAEETDLLASFTCNGGGLVSIGNAVAKEHATLLGGEPGPDQTTSPTVSPRNSPLINGMFGKLATNTTIPTGFHGSFAFAPIHGTPALVNGKLPVALSFFLGHGRAAIVADEEMFVDGRVSGCALAGWSKNSEMIFLNCFAFVMPPPTFKFTAQDVIFASYGQGCPGTNGRPIASWSGQPKPGNFMRFNVMNGLPGAIGVMVAGAQRFTQGMCWQHVTPIVFTLPIRLSAQGSARPGSVSLSAQVPQNIRALLVAQCVLLDKGGNRGLATSNGAEVIIR